MRPMVIALKFYLYFPAVDSCKLAVQKGNIFVRAVRNQID